MQKDGHDESLRARFAETLYMGAIVKERQFHKLVGGPNCSNAEGTKITLYNHRFGHGEV
jgi:hypothetical protein